MGTETTLSELLTLPVELLESVCSFLDPYQLVLFGRSCHHAATLTAPSNQTVWRNSFLQLFDDPNKAWAALLPTARADNTGQEAAWNWHLRTGQRCTALKATTTNDSDYRRQNADLTTNALLDIVETAFNHPSDRKSTTDKQRRKSLSIDTLDDTFSRSRDAERVIHDWAADLTSQSVPSEIMPSFPGRPVTRSMAQGRHSYSENASKLHTYYGLTRRERHSRDSQGNARCIAYDWHLTGPDVDYGPFKGANSGQWGHVNWTSLEAVSSLIQRHMELLVKDQITFPQGFKYAVPYQVPSNSSHPDDWAGVTGPWLGTYSFLDWTVLNQYNTQNHDGRGHSLLEGCDEARGDLMHLDLHLDASIKADPRLATKVPVCEDLPMLHFSGTSRGTGATRPYISVRGTASLVPGGRQVRWRFIIK